MPAKEKSLAKFLCVVSVLFLTAFGVIATAPSDAATEEPRYKVDQSQYIFEDLPNTHWAYSFVNYLYHLKATLGYPDKKIDPEKNITRAEFISVLAKAYGLPAITEDPPVFKDVASSAWYYGFVQAAAKAGLISENEGNFSPDTPITRQEMIIILAKALKLNITKESDGITGFSDVRIMEPWIKSYTASVVEQGLLVGYPDGTLRPPKFATRAEAYTIIIKVILKGLAPSFDVDVMKVPSSSDLPKTVSGGGGGGSDSSDPSLTCSVQQQLLQITGRNLKKRGEHWVQIYDGKNNLVGTIGVNVDSGYFATSYTMKGTEAEGNWQVIVTTKTSTDIEVSSVFYVPLSSIPEFPVGIAGVVVAGICALIYYRVRKGKEAMAA